MLGTIFIRIWVLRRCDIDSTLFPLISKWCFLFRWLVFSRHWVVSRESKASNWMNVLLHREQMNSSSIVCVLSCLFKRIYIFNLISYEYRWMAFFICLGSLMCFQTWVLCKFPLTLNAAKWLYIRECFPMILQYIWPPKFLSHWKELNGFWPVWILRFSSSHMIKAKFLATLRATIWFFFCVVFFH